MVMKIKYLLLFSLLMLEYSLAAVPNDRQRSFLSPSVADCPWAVWSWDNKDITFQSVRDKLDTMCAYFCNEGGRPAWVGLGNADE